MINFRASFRVTISCSLSRASERRLQLSLPRKRLRRLNEKSIQTPRVGVIKTVVRSRTLWSAAASDGKRSATPLWLERLALRWIRHKHKPKRRRASLAAALHIAVADTPPLFPSKSEQLCSTTVRSGLFRRGVLYFGGEFVTGEVFVSAFIVATTLKFAYPSGDRTVSLPSCVTTSPLCVFRVELFLPRFSETMTIISTANSTHRPRTSANLGFIPTHRHRAAAFCMSLGRFSI